MSDIEHLYLTVNDLDVHLTTAGRGPLVILLHGFPEFWYSWRYQIPVLAERFRVVAPDQRGYNLTQKPAGGYDLDTLATDVAELIHLLGYQQAHVVGHDWGGLVAWWLAGRHPERVDRLVIMNAPHPGAYWRALAGGDLRQILRSWYVLFFQIPRLPEFLLQRDDYRLIEQIFRGSTTRPEAFGDDVIRRYKRAAARPGALTAMLNWYRTAARRQTVGNLSAPALTILVPTLVIWGEQDVALGRELNDDLDRWVPDLTLRYLPAASHWVQQDRPAEVNRHLLDFLAK